jgi:hypothetical protein
VRPGTAGRAAQPGRVGRQHPLLPLCARTPDHAASAFVHVLATRLPPRACSPTSNADACRHCWAGLYEIKGAAPPRQPAGFGPLTAGSPALRRWRAYAHPHRSPATPARNPGSTLHTLTRQLTSEPPTRRRSIRPTPGRLKGACGVAARCPPATPDPPTPSGSCAPLWVRWLSLPTELQDPTVRSRATAARVKPC